MKNNLLISLTVILFVLLIIFLSLNIKKEKETNKATSKENTIIEDIKKHYNEYVTTNKETILYKKENDEYIEAGKINKNVNLKLSNVEINVDTKYFYLPDLDLYINYIDVEPIEKYTKNSRFKNYIYFNSNIITKNSTTFYDVDNNYLYTLNDSFEFKILIKDEDRYGVVFNDELLYISNNDVEKIYDNLNTDLKNKSKIRTLTYHFIYNPEKQECDQSICQSLEQFESHLKYIRENNYFTLNMDELDMYLDGKLQIPEKSIVITIDDGTTLDLDAVKLLEKYDINATLFVITSWVDPSPYKSTNLDFESHTDNMHNQYECKGYGMQGGGILCLPEEQILNDLKTSQNKLGGSKYFAYPFFDFNDRAIALLKKAGFKMAFIGQYDTEGYSYPKKTDKYKVRRMTIFSNTSMEEFISYLK